MKKGVSQDAPDNTWGGTKRKRRFHGITAIVANHLKGSVLRIPDESDLEIVHLVVKTSNPVLNVIGVYLDVESRSNTEKVQAVWAQLTAKVDNILVRYSK